MLAIVNYSHKWQTLDIIAYSLNKSNYYAHINRYLEFSIDDPTCGELPEN